VYDALTTTRSYRGAMSREQALLQLAESRHWWREDVYQTFLSVLKAMPEDRAAAA
jgi:HD-GYP domain-containing protein (c-di-GMP phosphodiesterase class II)